MSEYPCPYREDTHNWIYLLQHSHSPTRFRKPQAVKIDQDQKQTNKQYPSMPKLFIYSIICNVKRLAANNPKVLSEQFIELSMYIYTMEFYTAIKRNEKIFHYVAMYLSLEYIVN